MPPVVESWRLGDKLRVKGDQERALRQTRSYEAQQQDLAQRNAQEQVRMRRRGMRATWLARLYRWAGAVAGA
jgi:hypothetical protein